MNYFGQSRFFESGPSTSGLDRRAFLRTLGRGSGGLALGALMPKIRAAGNRPIGKSRAKNVIWMFMRGGVSHMESFDPKPALDRYAGKTISETPYAYVQDPERLKKFEWWL